MITEDGEVARQVRLARDKFQAALDAAYHAGLDVEVRVTSGFSYTLRKPNNVKITISKEL